MLQTILGVGLLTSTAIVGAVPDANAFKNGRHFAAWMGLVPRQHSTGRRTTLLGISKRGDKNLRSLVVHGARSRMTHSKLKSKWLKEVENRRGRNKAVVAQANKNARTIWSIMKHKEPYKMTS